MVEYRWHGFFPALFLRLSVRFSSNIGEYLVWIVPNVEMPADVCLTVCGREQLVAFHRTVTLTIAPITRPPVPATQGTHLISLFLLEVYLQIDFL